MKNLLRVVAVSVLFLGFLFTNNNSAQAATTYYPAGCTATTAYNTMTGQKCYSGNVLGVSTDERTITSVTVLSPNGGEQYTVGQDMTIKWEGRNIPTRGVRTEVSLTRYNVSTGVQYAIGPIILDATDVPNYFTYRIPTTYFHQMGPIDMTDPNIKWKAQVAMYLPGDIIVKDESDGFFTIGTSQSDCLPNSSPSITVLSPNGGESYTAGQRIEVKWESCNIPRTENIQVNLMDSISNIDFQANIITTPNDGQEIFTLPTTNWDGTRIIYGTRYKIGIWTIRGEGFPVYKDWSDNLFTINSDQTQTCHITNPSITVLSPNGGEVYQAGQQITVKWDSCNISRSSLVSIHSRFWNPGPRGVWSVNLLPYPHETINDGVEVVNLPTDFDILANRGQFGRNFEILVIDSNVYNPTMDNSDSLFTINSSQQTNCRINSFTANPTTVNPGGMSTLSWTTTGCTSASLDSSNVPVNGSSVSGPHTQNTTYTLYTGTLYPGCNSFYGFSSINGQPCSTGAETATATITVNSVTSGNDKIFVIGGSNRAGELNDIWSSSDMSTWTNVVPNGSTSIWSPRNFARTLYLNGKIYLIGGNRGNDDPTPVSYQFWSSSNGSTWQQLPTLPWNVDPYEHTLSKSYIVYNGKIWAIGGLNHDPAYCNPFCYRNTVWSFDGNSWRQEANAPWSGRETSGLVVYNGKIFMIGGYDGASTTTNEVWSFNGRSWTQEVSMPYSLGFQAGQQPIGPFQNKIWIFGNRQYSGNNVLSFDGRTWQQHPSAPWSTRADHLNVVANGKIYIMGGLHSENYVPPTYLNEVWSFDGSNWTQLPDATWPARGYFDGVVVPATFGMRSSIGSSDRLVNTNFNSKGILRIGSKGDDVKTLQSLLGIKADGIYGRGTAAKVKEWQKANGLKADGAVGVQSWAKINSQ